MSDKLISINELKIWLNCDSKTAIKNALKKKNVDYFETSDSIAVTYDDLILSNKSNNNDDNWTP